MKIVNGMKIIFLDIDGVLNSEEFFIHREHTPEAKKKWTEQSDIDRNAVELLNKITDATDAKIVISSAWRVGRTKEWLDGFFTGVGVRGKVVDRTANFSNERLDEVKDWLEIFPEVEKFIILDDEFDWGNLSDRFVKTSWKTGLTDYHVEKAIELLK